MEETEKPTNTKSPLQVKLESALKSNEDEREEIKTEIHKLTKFFSNINELARNKHILYEYRQTLVGKKQENMTLSNITNRASVKQRRSIYDSYKFGTRRTSNQQQIMPKNDTEREMYMNDDMRDYDAYLKAIDDHILFLRDSIKNIDDMVFGIPYAIELEKYNTVME